MSLGTAVRTKLYYDDVNGNPVDVTSKVLKSSNTKIKGLLEKVTPFGVRMKQMIPTGRGELEPITINGLLETEDVAGLDALFGGRLPEDPDTPTRTWKEDYIGDGTSRTLAVETYLEEYDIDKNNDTGLVKVSIKLMPTGEITEVINS